MKHDEFFKRYKAVLMHQGQPIPPTRSEADYKSACGVALKAMEKAGKSMQGVQIGKTMVLYKAVQVLFSLLKLVVFQRLIMRCSTKKWNY